MNFDWLWSLMDGATLRLLREEIGVTQGELGVLLGKSAGKSASNNISWKECDRRVLRPDERIAVRGLALWAPNYSKLLAPVSKEEFKEIRKRLGLLQRELGDIFDLSKAVVSHRETGVKEIPASQGVALRTLEAVNMVAVDNPPATKWMQSYLSRIEGVG